ncbi:MAG: peptidoglycan DD-metalloendopeptidase family protein [Fidelibacterota bacterium]
MRAPKHQYSYIFQAESDQKVRQYHFTLGKVFGSLILGCVLLGAGLFFSTDFLTDVIYKTRLSDIENKYRSLSNTLNELQSQIGILDSQIADIEEQDKAVRMYADLPGIDQDVRDLGVGGVQLEQPRGLDGPAPDLEQKISDLELNVDQLSRQVKLELASYRTIYDKVKTNTELMKNIPSIRPVYGGYLNSPFGYRIDPFDGKRRFHYGQDFSVPSGTPIYATADGVVQQARYRGGFGKTIKINNGNGYSTIYAHLSKISVKYGQKVKRGDIIGYSGNTGRSTGPHVHYEVHYYGTPQNPLDYFFSGYLK